MTGTPKALYETIYCARGQMENRIKAHKLHLASDRTSCSKATANQFRLLIHNRCLLAAPHLARLGAEGVVLA
ncbi:Transposase [Azospirillum argentinense]|uniref:Transposase DDE domain-containing protein n=1 Tax=Azospirillum argentinense TaxID=2970906 RepID=A0A5B0KY83_9PROT|nr:Transposase [Azospirillum argentinense]